MTEHNLIRSLSTRHPLQPNIEYRVGYHRPTKLALTGVIPDGDPYVIVEMWLRNDHGDWKMIGGFKIEDFVHVSRDVVQLSRLVTEQASAPRSYDADGDSTSRDVVD